MNKRQGYIFILSISVLMLSCHTVGLASLRADTIPFVARYNMSDLPYTNHFGAGKVCGLIRDPAIGEASGLVCGRRNRDMLYTVNDHGNRNELFMLDRNGNRIATFYIDDCPDRDWESVAIDDNNKSKIPYIYIADIGDNSQRYKAVYIYRIMEPRIPKYHDKPIRLDHVKKYTLVYPDGPHNAETFFIDPVSEKWYIITKGEGARVYGAGHPQDGRDTVHLKYLGMLPFPSLTDGDISFNGMALVLKNYKNIYYWKRKGVDETISRMLQRAPDKIRYKPEVHGESVGWTWDAAGFYTTSEKRGSAPPKIYFYKYNR